MYTTIFKIIHFWSAKTEAPAKYLNRTLDIFSAVTDTHTMHVSIYLKLRKIFNFRQCMLFTIKKKLLSRWFLGISKSTSPPIAVYFSVKLCQPIYDRLLFIKRYLKARWMAAVSSEELRTVLWMFVILLAANFKFRNRCTCSKGSMKKAGKVCGDSQDLKSPG